MAQVRPHTSSANVETFLRVNLTQIRLHNQVSLSIQAVGDFGMPRKESNLNLSLFYAEFYTSMIQLQLQRSVLLALYLLIDHLRLQKRLCNTQLVVGVSPEPGSSWCEFS